MSKKLISLLCCAAMLFSFYSFMIPVYAKEASGEIIEGGDVPLRLHYDEEAPYGNEGVASNVSNKADDGWEKWSLPIGNGYFGANVFGRTETERIQITEKTLANPYYRKDSNGTQYTLGGLNNFSETYIDFGHTNSAVSDYSRWLDLETALSGVCYSYNGVTYTREYFTSYPDKALVIRLDASETGALSFTLRPTVPWQQDYAAWVGDGASKTGTVTSTVENGVGEIELYGKMGYYDIDFLGIYKVFTNGGTVNSGTADYTYTDTAGVSHTEKNGTIVVNGATSAYIVVTLGTDYELTSDVFTSSDANKPTFNTTLADTRAKVEAEMNAVLAKISDKSYDEGYNVLKDAHLDDYTELFSRVTLNLGSLEDAALTTDDLLAKYKTGDYSPYLETLYYQYGRYLLIASSREGALPANLQGTWNRYNYSPWASGYWHNINVQMNYWHAFSTNLTETFLAYVDYNEAYMPAAEANASAVIAQYNSSKKGLDGGDGWCIGTSAFPNEIAKDRSAGNLGFTTQLFWEYYDYTRDPEILESVYEILVSAARFITKTVELDEEGHYLVSYCDSPEMHVNGVWYYTVGTTYAQTFAYINNFNALTAAKTLGIDLSDTGLLSTEEYSILKTIMEQIDKYDPIHVGLSGQIKEFREEDYYASVADDPHHRHISQLVGLYPGNIINSTTEAWLDAAIVTLTERGDKATGWGMAHRLNAWARTKMGDRTYQVLNKLLSEGTATNLWDLHPPFQIDGNFGGTAGITEMLLQSHEGYIAPLAALPSAWSEGSYTGLVARGNFEVSAKWSNGVATVFNITSNAGERVSVSYSGIASATVTTASGKKVDFDVSGKDIISFDTEKGETYIISGFTVPEEVNDVSKISAEREGFGPISLSWTKTANVYGYNLYVAFDNDADYTLIASVNSSSFVYTPDKEHINSRFTFKVKAYDASGNESRGAICYLNPIDVVAHVEDYEANVFGDDELQVIVKATDNAKTYKLWKMAEGKGDYTLVLESAYPVLIYEGYSENDKYALSIVSNLLDTEGELYELNRIRTEASSSEGGANGWVSNILLGLTVMPNPDAPTNIWSSAYGYDKLTDGGLYKQPDGTTNQHASRYSTKSATDVLDGTVNLGNTYLINEVRLYDYSGSMSHTRAGDNIVVYVLSGGVWTEAARLDGKNAVVAAKVRDDAESITYVSIKLGYVAADAIRVVASNDTATEGITLYEMTASGILVDEKKIDVDNVFVGKNFSGNLTPFGTSFGYEKLTDGSFEHLKGRFALKDEGNQNLVIECDLGEVYDLYELKIYDLCDGNTPRIKSFTVEVYYNGEWLTVINSASMPSKDKRTPDSNGSSSVFALGGAKAEKIRMTCLNGSEAKGVSIYEIMCSGKKKNDGNGNNILEGVSFTGTDTIVGSAYGYAGLTDGKYGLHDGRFALKPTGTDRVVFECELDALYSLYDLKIYDWCDGGNPRMKDLVVELYYAGEWITVLEAPSMPIWSDRAADSNGRASAFDLGGAKGERIRISCTDGSGQGISIYEITCSGVKSTGESASTNAFTDNVKSLSATGSTVYTSYPLENAFDGKKNTRYALLDKGNSYVLEIELKKAQRLYTLNIYDFRNPTDKINGKLATRSNETYIELFVNGEWIRVVDAASMTVDKSYTSFYLYGIAASKIRIGFKNTRPFDDGSQPLASIYEITCTTSAAVADRKPILEAYEKLDNVAYGDSDHDSKMEKYYSYLTAFELDADSVALMSEEMNAYYETVKNNVIKYVPKTSITLGSELVMNVYIPAKYLLKFTLDGISYENLALLSENKVTLETEEEYYKMTVLLPSAEAARDIKLVCTVENEEARANVTFTLKVQKYARKAIEKGTDVEKTLIRDVLSYVSAAYSYFNSPDKDAVISEIDSIIGKKYDELSPVVNEGSEKEAEGFKLSTFALKEAPAFRFYLNDGDDGTKYTFKINGKAVSSTLGSDEKGAYVEVRVYAYALSETIYYYVDGKEAGSYHIASYYAWAKKQNDTALVKLVERLWKYCVSARDYKNSVAVQINYVDEAGNKMAEPYVNRYKNGEAISIPSPSIDGYYTKDLYVIENVSPENNVFDVIYKITPSNIDADTVDKYLSDIVAWGDSITAGAFNNEVTSANQYGIDLKALGSSINGGSYVTVLKNLIASKVYSGIDVSGLGVGGEATSSIASRADTETYYLYLNGAVTISSGAVTVPLTHYSSGGRVGILRQGGSAHVNPVTIIGKDASGNEISVSGSLTLSLTDDAPSGTDVRTCDAKYLKYTFTRDDGKTNTLSFVSGARVVTKASYLYDGRTCIIFMGENGGYSDTDELIKQQEEILKACGNPEYYLIISSTSGSNESRTAVREALSRRWGEHYINMGDELNSSRKAYEFAGFSEEAILSVQESIVNGTVTKLLINDTCHPNAVGYAVIANIILERLFKLGAFDELFDYYDRLSTVTTETFEFNGYTATVVRPADPNGKWIWKTEFFTAFDKAERTLLDDGYTRVYYQISNKYGNPESVSLMESFYHEVTKRYGLDDKCILFGFSRGGLYAFNFALECPEYVDKIYLDAPVLDLKTWPTKSKNPGEFSGMLASYGLTEEEFVSFKGSPIDKLEEFFALNIPLLVVAGDSDATVPFEDNAGRLIEYALANGHNITYVVEEGKDHHPHSLTDVTLIVDFCNRGSYENAVSNPLTKEELSGKTVTFLGDSITYGVGASSTANRYSSLVASSLGMTEINMGISGTVMCTGGHRTSRLDDIKKISLDSDYVGILLGINDFDQCRNDGTSKYYALGEFGTTDTTTVYGALDKMCKDLVERFGKTDTKVFLMTPVITSWNNSVSGTRDWDQNKVNACGYTLRELCDAIVEVATYYGIVTLDLNTACEMSASDFSDGIHPNDSGAKKIADEIEVFLLANYSFV